jgi:hypothetical protein
VAARGTGGEPGADLGAEDPFASRGASAAAADDEDDAVPLGSLALQELGEEIAGVLDAAAMKVETGGGGKGAAAELAEQTPVEIPPPAPQGAPKVFELELRGRGGGCRP